MPSYAISGTFVNGNKAGRSSVACLYTRDLLMNVGMPGISTLSHSLCFRGVWGYAQGLTWNSDATSYNSDNLAGRHMQIGLSRDTVSGSLGDSCLVMNTIGFWRFRWAIRANLPHTVTVQAQQNSTGSIYRPTMVIKANPSIGVNNDVSGSAADGNGYQTIGPLVVNPTSTGYVWVELHNNNTYYPVVGLPANATITPCIFDHLVTT